MKPWASRPRDIRNLFNPAFCGVVLARSIEGFTATANKPMPFSLTLLILPLCLHKRSRETLKAANKSYLAKIIENHPELQAGLAERARGLMPYTLEAYGLLMTTNRSRIRINYSIDKVNNSSHKLFGIHCQFCSALRLTTDMSWKLNCEPHAEI